MGEGLSFAIQEGIVEVLARLREMTIHQREFMAAMLVRNPVVQNPQSETDQNLEVLSIPPPQENNQQGDM